MGKVSNQENDTEIIEMVETIPFDDGAFDDDIREWLQQTPVQIRNDWFKEVDREEEYYAMKERLSVCLMER